MGDSAGQSWSDFQSEMKLTVCTLCWRSRIGWVEAESAGLTGGSRMWEAFLLPIIISLEFSQRKMGKNFLDCRLLWGADTSEESGYVKWLVMTGLCDDSKNISQILPLSWSGLSQAVRVKCFPKEFGLIGLSEETRMFRCHLLRLEILAASLFGT